MATKKRTKSPSRAKKAKTKTAAKPRSSARASGARKPAGAKKRAAAKPSVRSRTAAAATKAKAKGKAKTQAKAKAKAKPRAKPAKAKAPTERATKPRAPRHDRAGHLAPDYAKELRARSRETRSRDGTPDEGFLSGDRARDDLAQELGEETVGAMTTGEERATESLNADVDEEWGGPFVPSTGGREFAEGTDASNPKDAEKEPFPRT